MGFLLTCVAVTVLMARGHHKAVAIRCCPACGAIATHVRIMLPQHADLVPDGGSLSDAEQGSTLERLTDCCDVVSRQDALTREEAVHHIRVLLKAQRLASEYRRASSAVDRRWFALTEEGRTLTEKSKQIRSAH
eukprot:2573911-Amphidinium_carterae.1